MIRALLEDAERYYVLGEGVKLALNFVRDNDLVNFAPGRYPVDGDRVFALIQERDSMLRSEAPFENHVQHADLQVTLRGVEYLGYCPIKYLTKKGEYNAETDVQLYEIDEDAILMRSDTGKSFSLFYPEDGHQPYVTLGDPAPLKKVVFRIRKDMLAGV
ncbi:MAG: DUF386 domain-containing protein [Fretibacterium sp.]|nr:DUF386 domain-containing protein [Fretibacterium sp.]